MYSFFKFKSVAVAAVLALQVGQFAASSAHANEASGTYTKIAMTYASIPIAVVGTGVVIGGAVSGNVLSIVLGGVAAAAGIGSIIYLKVAADFPSFKEMYVKQIKEDATQCLALGCEEPSAILSSLIDHVRAATAQEHGQEAADSLTAEAIAESLLSAEYR